jgi:hypothetical protein
VFLDPRLIVGSIPMRHDATGLGRTFVPIPVPIELIELELQGAHLGPTGSLGLTDDHGIGYLRPPSGPSQTGFHRGRSGAWQVDVFDAVPGSTVEVWTDGLDVPIRLHGTGTVGPDGTVRLHGNARLPGDARLSVRIRGPEVGAPWRSLGLVPGAAG